MNLIINIVFCDIVLLYKQGHKKVKTIETEYVNMTIKDGILHFSYKEIESLDLEIAKKCVRDRIEFSENTSYPCLVDAVLIKNVSREARDYFANEGNDLITANALLVKSHIFKMIVNFFINVSKPRNPTKMFTDKSQAVKWLKQFRDLAGSDAEENAQQTR